MKNLDVFSVLQRLISSVESENDCFFNKKFKQSFMEDPANVIRNFNKTNFSEIGVTEIKNLTDEYSLTLYIGIKDNRIYFFFNL